MSHVQKTIPITILNGFLGAGKTTLLQSLLAQANADKDVTLGVIVNEMSTLDVDGRVLVTNELLSKDDPRFFSISAKSISSHQGLKQCRKALNKMKAAGVTHIILETSGSTHPWPLLKMLQAYSGVKLHGFLSLVDTVTLARDYDLGRVIVPAASKHLNAGQRGVENLLAEQIMFASRILLTKADKVPHDVLQQVGAHIHPINPWVDITGIQWGNLNLRDILAMPPYDYNRVAKLGEELTEWDRANGNADMSSTSEHKLDTIVIEDQRPMHPQRLWNVYNYYLGQDIYRSKGFFWMPSRDRLQLLWNQTGGSVAMGVMNFWKIAALEDDSLNLSLEEKEGMKKRMSASSPVFGDRHCRLTVIGDAKNLNIFAAALKEAICSDAEVLAWRNGEVFDDPWPQNVASVNIN